MRIAGLEPPLAARTWNCQMEMSIANRKGRDLSGEQDSRVVSERAEREMRRPGPISLYILNGD